MAYFEKAGEGGGQVQAITGTQSKAAMYDMIGDDNVLLSLGNKAVPNHNAKAKPKVVITQKQKDENSRKQLAAILEEQ